MIPVRLHPYEIECFYWVNIVTAAMLDCFGCISLSNTGSIGKIKVGNNPEFIIQSTNYTFTKSDPPNAKTAKIFGDIDCPEHFFVN